MVMSIDRSIIGRSSDDYTCTVEAGKIKEFAAAIGENSDLFWNDAPAPIAPPTFSHIFRSGKMQLLMTDCGLDATKFLHGEHDITYYRPLRAGETVVYNIELVDVIEKHGQRSGPMDVVVLQTLVRDQSGNPIQKIRQTFVAKR
jgi:N-terminal half of MaoC dehydratase